MSFTHLKNTWMLRIRVEFGERQLWASRSRRHSCSPPASKSGMMQMMMVVVIMCRYVYNWSFSTNIFTLPKILNQSFKVVFRCDLKSKGIPRGQNLKGIYIKFVSNKQFVRQPSCLHTSISAGETSLKVTNLISSILICFLITCNAHCAS